MNTDGYAAMPRAYMADQRLTPSERLTYLGLSFFVGADHTCWPSLTALAVVTGLSKATLKRTLPVLESYGYIRATTRRNRDTGRYTSTRYRLLTPMVTVTTRQGSP